jgi:hypothetical protein
MSSQPNFQHYWDQHFGLRAGTDKKGAAYAMTDLDDLGYTALQIALWVHDPKKLEALTPLWHERLQNSICKIESLSKDKMNILIVSKAGVSGERYGTSTLPCTSGKHQTFKKTNKLPPDSEPFTQKEFDANPAGVTEAIKWVSGIVGR